MEDTHYIGDIDTIIEELETEFEEVHGLTASDVEVPAPGFSEGSCTNGCTHGCTGGCTGRSCS